MTNKDVKANTTFQYRISQREAQAGIFATNELVDEYTRQEQYRRLGKMIGHTPLLKTEEIGDTIILTKYEACNPSKSHYDRAYFNVLKTLEADGVITPGDQLFEITSGSAGTSFAWLCSRLGFDSKVIVPPELPSGRTQEMKNFGTQVVESDAGYVPEAASELRRAIKSYKADGYDVEYIKKDDAYFVIKATKLGEQSVVFVNHSEHQLVVDSFKEISQEIIDVLPRDVIVDDLALILGNWTTATGITTLMREVFPNVRVTGIEDATAPVYYEQMYGSGSAPQIENADELQMTFGASARKVYGDVRLKFDDISILDDIGLVHPADRDQVRDEFNNRYSHGHPKNVGESIGNSSAAALYVARKLATETRALRTNGQRRVIVVLAYDHLDRYGDAVLSSAMANHQSIGRPIANGSILEISTQGQRGVLPLAGFVQSRAKSLDDLPTDLSELFHGPAAHILIGASLS